MNNQKDLAEKQHWDFVYSRSKLDICADWKPEWYIDRSIEYMLMTEINRAKPKRILEIGCGKSAWLPYLAKKMNVEVCGLDYSEEGCKLARKRLENENTKGIIYCEDLFQANPEKIGCFDFVFSLGVAEHFLDLEDALSHMLKFVKPNGVLLTEVPNLASIHGLLCWIYQPRQLAKHQRLTKKKLDEVYKKLGLGTIESSYLGLFSLSIVAWGLNPRFQSLDKFALPKIKKIVDYTDKVLSCFRIYKGSSLLAPYLYVTGTKIK